MPRGGARAGSGRPPIMREDGSFSDEAKNDPPPPFKQHVVFTPDGERYSISLQAKYLFRSLYSYLRNYGSPLPDRGAAVAYLNRITPDGFATDEDRALAVEAWALGCREED